MSSFYGKAINPKTKKVQVVLFRDDYFGNHQYGIVFPDNTVYRPDEVEIVYE